MDLSTDIRIEKFLEAMVEQFAAELGEEIAKECPVLRGMADCLAAVKASNNAEIRIEMGLVGNCGRCGRCSKSGYTELTGGDRMLQGEKEMRFKPE